MKINYKYTLETSKTAKKQLKKLPQGDRILIEKKLKKSKDDPFHYFKRLEESTIYSMRIKFYRVLASIIMSQFHILVITIDKRDQVYDKKKKHKRLKKI